MINILLTALLFHSIFMYVFRLRSTSLNCGLFGGSFNRPLDDLIIERLKILGFFNMSRGKDSCGYYNGHSITKGVDKHKEFYDLIIAKGIPKNENGNNIFIGHTRQSTYGSNTAENAHPFNINNQLVLAHNGTISNIWDLCRDHNVPHKDIFVDSKALGEILNKDGYKVLEEYKGGAALIIHRVKEPGTLYVYHGGSFNYNTDNFIEERPLFWLQKEEGVYLSSLKGALDYIRTEGDEEVCEVPHNEIWRINKGVKCKKASFTIDRTIGDTPKYVYTPYVPATTVKKDNEYPTRTLFPIINPKFYISTPKDENEGLKIEDEAEPTYDFNCIFFSRGRYRKSYIGTVSDATIIDAKTSKIVNSFSDGMNPKRFYFYRGVYIKDQRSWETISKALDNKTDVLYKALSLDPNVNFAKEISKFSKYPVTNCVGESIGLPEDVRQTWYARGKPVVVEAITPLFSKRDYHFKSGRLIRIVSKEKAIIYSKSLATNQEMTKKEADDSISSLQESALVEKLSRVYSSVLELKEEIGPLGLNAIDLYASDVLQAVLDECFDQSAVKDIVDDLLMSSVISRVPISKLIDPKVDMTIEGYVADTLTLSLDMQNEIDDESITDAAVIDAETEYVNTNPDYNDPMLSDEQALEVLQRKNEQQMKAKAIYYNTGNVNDEVIEFCSAPNKKPALFDDDEAFVSQYTLDKKKETDSEDLNTFHIEAENEIATNNVNKLTSAFKDLNKLSDEFGQLFYSDLAQNINKKLEECLEEMRYKIAEEYRAANKFTQANLIDKTSNIL